MSDCTHTALDKGAGVIRDHAASLPDTPGVYRMLSEAGEVLYVGKALSLRSRVRSYVHVGQLSIRIQRMVAQTHAMEFVHTHTEAEALLLESNLIKSLKPRYNILLRDDKSFPHILLTGDHDFPLVTKHRGAKKRKGEYFGPFAGAGDVNRTIAILQRVFMLRNCPDTVFANRTRPCLQYHIKRCTAPCVAKVSKGEYAQQVDQARDFLQGKSDAVNQGFSEAMREASDGQDYERAAHYRDRIKALSAVQSHQNIHIEGIEDADIVALAQREGRSCVQVFFFRGGRHFGNRAYFPRHDKARGEAEVVAAFVAQFYENKQVPRQILISHEVEERALIKEALSARAGRVVDIVVPQRGKFRRAIDFALDNAKASLARHLAVSVSEGRHLSGVASLFDLDEPPVRIEVYDNSHISGTDMVGGMIVAGPDGFEKNAYRKFNIKQAKASDDYGMMREVLSRRFKRALKDSPDMVGWPDLVLIDGGKGQLSAAYDVFEELGIADSLNVVAIGKGEDRNAGRETFYMRGRAPFQRPEGDSTLHYLQRLRDEAHRFAIGSHRKKRENRLYSNPLDGVPGVGAARKRALLSYFGSAKAVAQAGAKDLERVRGVSKSLAQKIYDHFH